MASVISVAVVAQPLITSDPRTAGDAAIKAILGDTSIVGEIVDNAVYGFSYQFEQYYQAGLNSTFGLPKLRPVGAYMPELTAVIKSLEDGQHPNPVHKIVFQYIDFQPVTREDFATDALFKQYEGGYKVLASYDIMFDDSGAIDDITKFGWSYIIGTGTYPQLDSKFSDVGAWYGDYMPIAALRANDNYLSDTYKASNYAHTKKLLSKVGYSVEDLIESLNGDPDNPNNIDELQDVMVGCFADMDSEEPYVIRYLVSMFEKYNDIHGDPPANAEDLLDQKSKDSSFNTGMDGGLNIYSGVRDVTSTQFLNWVDELQYGTVVAWHYVTRETVNKVIGEVGHATREVVLQDFSRSFTKEWDKSYIDYFVQITPTTCRKIRVVGLGARTNINRNEFHGSATYHIEDLLNTENKAKIVIPLNRGLLDNFTVTERNLIYARTFQLVIYAEKWTKLKWYETATFKLFITVIAVAISLYTLSPQIGALISAGSIYVAGQILLQIVLTQILTQYVIKKVFSLVVDLIGAENAVYLAAIVSVVAGAKGIMVDFLDYLPSAADLLVASNALIKQSSLAFSEEMRDIQEELTNLTTDYNEKMDLIEEAAEGLSFDLSPLDIVESIEATLVIESTDTFYSRTLNTNPGLQGMAMLSNFVDTALTLPRYNELT